MKLVLSLNDIKIMHDSVCTFEEMASDDPDTLGDKGQYTNLRQRLKAMIDHIETKAVVEVEVEVAGG